MGTELNPAVFLATLLERFEKLEQTLDDLDAATGDGDHGTTILKGLRAAAGQPDEAAAAFRRAAGGASGSLFAQVLAALLEALAGRSELPAALAKAADRIAAIGSAKPGDKTMLDALLPAAAASGTDGVSAAARAGADATVQMAAKRGRARYVEGAGVGHMDAGARSVVEMIDTYADHKAGTE